MQSSASKSGARARAQEDEHSGSGATSEKDPGNQNEKAKRDHPEAPGPVIGMNDERGGVSFFFLHLDLSWVVLRVMAHWFTEGAHGVK